MANKLYEESSIQAIATAIRGKNGSSDTYTVSQMANAISNISGGSELPADACLGSSRFTSLPNDFVFGTRTSCYQLFRLCNNMTTAPSITQLDTSSVTTMYEMFAYCGALTTVPLYDTREVTDMRNMFYNDSLLVTCPAFNTPKVTSTGQMFYNCYALATAPSLDLSNVTNAYNMFLNCTGLVTVPVYNLTSANNLSNMFGGCASLTTETQSLSNILQSLINGTSLASGNKKLTYIFGTGASGTVNYQLVEAAAARPEWATLSAAGWTTGH